MWAGKLLAVGFLVHWAHLLLWPLVCLLSMLSVGITLKTDYKKPKKTLLTSKDTLRLRQSIGLDPNETTKAQWAAVPAPVFSSRRKAWRNTSIHCQMTTCSIPTGCESMDLAATR
jgi:hypothetical protein